MRTSRIIAITAALTIVAATPARAQTLDPRYYVNTPVGMNFAVGGFMYGWGSVLFDPTVPIEDAHLNFEGPAVGYARALDLWGLSGKASIGESVLCLHGSGVVQGTLEERDVCGLSDLNVGLSVNVLGAPALGLREFRNYKQGFLLGASLNASVPVGQYDPDKLVNIGTHRWSIRPQVGASQTLGRLIIEGLASVTIFTTNNDFFGGHVRTQAPLYAGQVNLIYTFRSGIWGSLGVTAYAGGRSTLDDVASRDITENWRLGGSLVIPVSRHNSLKLLGGTGLYARTGGNFSSVAASWVYLWGGRM